MLDKKFASKVMLALSLGLIVLVATVFAHCATTVPRPNSLGVVQEYTNPNTYLIAEPVELTTMQDERGRIYTNVRFEPLNTAAFYDESILFCGEVPGLEKLPMAITYLTRASLMYKGIACHKFVSAFEVK